MARIDDGTVHTSGPHRVLRAPIRGYSSVRSVALTLILIFSTVVSQPVLGQTLTTFSYDPITCQANVRDRIHVTLYGTVFALPVNHLHFISSVASRRRHLVPPPVNPNEPQGCPDNPLPGSTFIISIPMPEGLVLSDPGLDGFASEDTIPVRRLAIRAAESDFFGLQHSFLATAERFCAIGVISIISPYFNECLVEPTREVDRQQWGGSYISNPLFYSMPFGEPFVIECMPGSPVRNCYVSYKIYNEVNLDYGLDITEISPTDFIEVDSVIRETLSSWLVDQQSAQE